MTSKSSSYTKWIDEYTEAKVALAASGGFRGEIWMNSSYARAQVLDWNCSHNHSNREDALACAIAHA
jgi:hypothetical protein